MRPNAKLLAGALVVGAMGLQPVGAQAVRPPWLNDSSAPLPASLARVLSESARDIRTGRPTYLVANRNFPEYVIGAFGSDSEALQKAQEAGPEFGAFGPFITPRDMFAADQATIDSVTVYVSTPSGPESATVTPQEVDALFLTPAAVDKFMVPFYAGLYGPVIAGGLRQQLLRAMAGACHKYITRACWPRRGFPVVPISDPGLDR